MGRGTTYSEMVAGEREGERKRMNCKAKKQIFKKILTFRELGKVCVCVPKISLKRKCFERIHFLT